MSETTESARQKMEEMKLRGDEGRRKTYDDDDAKRQGREGFSDTIVIKVEESPAGAVDATVRSSDETFNAVGRVGEEGVIRDRSSKTKM